jgi:hypothetical protein
MSEETKPLISEKTKTGLEILEASILLGILGDTLLRATPLGLNVFLWMAVFVAAIAALVVRRKRADIRGLQIHWFFIPLILFSAFFGWRDSNVLMVLNMVVILATLAMITLKGQNIAVRLLGFFQYGFGAFSAAVDIAFAPFYLLFADIKWKTIPRKGWTKHLFSALRGLAIALPILLVFGALFMAADAVFEGIINQTFNISPDVIFAHGFFIVFFSWISAGFLRGIVIRSEILYQAFNFKKDEPQPAETKLSDEKTMAESPVEKLIHQSDEPVKQAEAATNEKKENKFFSLGLMETSIVLGLMNLLFLSFVIIQIRYFFGGAQLIQQITNLTYAEYARRGFFELVWVALLVLPILLIIQWLLRKDNPLNEKVFRYLAGGQIALLFVIMASALSRMMLYQNEYGLTELRVYTTAFMIWLAVVFLLFCATVLVGKRERFLFGAYLSILLFVAALHFVNPDALIARVNIERLGQGKFFDADYASKLSADAIPVLVGEFPAMSYENRCVIQNKLVKRQSYEANKDWRSWNWARQNAWQTVESQAGTWNLADCPKPQNVSRDAF